MFKNVIPFLTTSKYRRKAISNHIAWWHLQDLQRLTDSSFHLVFSKIHVSIFKIGTTTIQGGVHNLVSIISCATDKEKRRVSALLFCLKNR